MFQFRSVVMSGELVQLATNTGLPAVPDYLKNVEGDKSLDSIKQYVRPPRVKVVQAMTDEKIKELFGVGDVVLLPDNIGILKAARDERGNVLVGQTIPFVFTPLFFFTEFCLWNPLEMKGKLPAIRERTFDHNSKIAIRARDFHNRKMPCPEDPAHDCIFCEHLNFIIKIQGHDEPAILTFSRGEFKAGQNFAALIKMRGVPLYANIFAANLAHRKNDKGNWYGLDISNPNLDDTSPYVGEELFKQYQQFFEKYMKDFEEKLIEVNYEDDVIDVPSVSEAASSI